MFSKLLSMFQTSFEQRLSDVVRFSHVVIRDDLSLYQLQCEWR